jgi:hypothetical protein
MGILTDHNPDVSRLNIVLLKISIFFSFNALDSIRTHERAAHGKVATVDNITNIRGDRFSMVAMRVCCIKNA